MKTEKLIKRLNKIQKLIDEIGNYIVEEGDATRSAAGILLPKEAGKKK